MIKGQRYDVCIFWKKVKVGSLYLRRSLDFYDGIFGICAEVCIHFCTTRLASLQLRGRRQISIPICVGFLRCLKRRSSEIIRDLISFVERDFEGNCRENRKYPR
ncbi:uncharacterized protein LOC143893433 isoform X2 [Temnothorax americanus]|uniref:uncharacterized protein LOC143893433 isoform X2 n=1 Tax=Temnothorax americanus TaxID=1964332 RepID=UPI004068B21F